MAKLKNYYNPISNDTELFTREDIKNMSAKEFHDKQNAVFYQYGNLGIPTNKQLENNENVIHVKGYYKNDGTHVKAHYRTKPDSILENNLSYKNKNIYNGKVTKFPRLEGVRGKLQQKNEDMNKYRPNAKELMDLALFATEKKVPDSEAFSKVSDSYKHKLAKDLNLDKAFEHDRELDWYTYSDDSLLSQSLSNSPELQNKILKQYNTETHSFKDNKFLIDFSDINQDLHYAFGQASIINPKIDKYGNFSGLLFDKYDFYIPLLNMYYPFFSLRT